MVTKCKDRYEDVCNFHMRGLDDRVVVWVPLPDKNQDSMWEGQTDKEFSLKSKKFVVLVGWDFQVKITIRVFIGHSSAETEGWVKYEQ
jgi:hypothetical protein